jgi:succinate-acetate transporter protein
MSQLSDLEKGGSSLPRPSRIGNPGALGLFSFASTTFILSLINVQARGVATPNVVVGMAIFTGGLVQLLAGMWEFPRGNVFGATAFSSYGAFWMSYATILIPSSGIVASYAAAPPQELHDALGIYLITWFMFTFLMLIGALRKNIAFILLFAFLAATFALLAAAEFSGKANLGKAGGALGIITAMIAYYCALSEVLVPSESWFTLPLGQIPKD